MWLRSWLWCHLKCHSRCLWTGWSRLMFKLMLLKVSHLSEQHILLFTTVILLYYWHINVTEKSGNVWSAAVVTLSSCPSWFDDMRAFKEISDRILCLRPIQLLPSSSVHWIQQDFSFPAAHATLMPMFKNQTYIISSLMKKIGWCRRRKRGNFNAKTASKIWMQPWLIPPPVESPTKPHPLLTAVILKHF